MSVTIRIPTPLRQFCGNADELPAPALTVGEALKDVTRRYPMLRNSITAETGDLRGYVNVFVNTRDIRTLDRLDTPLRDGDVVHILPSIAGG